MHGGLCRGAWLEPLSRHLDDVWPGDPTNQKAGEAETSVPFQASAQFPF
jgi:hypothetical protein